MRRVNIQSDVESRRSIAIAFPQTPVTVPQVVTESNNTQEDGKTEEVQGDEDNTPTQTEPDTTTKRGRKTTGNAQKV